ncbi:MAG TPA: DUF3574 domain-containing protein [Gemmatimonadales bacterium]|nr:DUF3574 domain-containing protein [Gemmatimonadales bacterium]
MRPASRIAGIVLAVGCATARAGPPVTPTPTRVAVEDRLYFGRDCASGCSVSDADFTAFLNEVVTPRFPGGLTVWRAVGRWRDSTGTVVREDSFVLDLVHDEAAAADVAIRDIVDAYKRRFHQTSVLLVRQGVRVSY